MVMLCFVSLMTPTAAVMISLVLHREAGSFPMEILLVFFFLKILVMLMRGTGDKVLYVYIVGTIHHKEDASTVYC